MSLFIPNIPQPNDNLDFSQGQLLSNNQGLDTVFGIDHYKFSDASANKGFHNTVTTPQFVKNPPVLPSVPPTTTINPVFYGYQSLDGAGNPIDHLGLLQYSRGPTNAIPTPLTSIQSPATGQTINATSTINIFDFTGITFLAIADVYALNRNTPNIIAFDQKTLYWNGTNITLSTSSPATLLTIISSGTNLQLRNAAGVAITDVFWTISFKRIQ